MTTHVRCVYIWQREETIYHLFLRCNFARACWDSIGLFARVTTNPEIAVQRFKRQLNVPFFHGNGDFDGLEHMDI
jgi:hypothetical protein